MSPLIRQYFAIKEKYKGAVLLFRVGDFYETFNEDEKIIAHHLNSMLVQMEDDADIKLSDSLPYYSLDIALRKLTKAGYKVAVCDQLEAPKAGPMKRGVTDILEREKWLKSER